MKTKRLGLVVQCFGILLFPVLMYFSHKTAMASANTFMQLLPGAEDITYNGGGICLLRSLTGKWGPSWEFDFDPHDSGVCDFTIQVDLFGNIMASNPPSLVVDYPPR